MRRLALWGVAALAALSLTACDALHRNTLAGSYENYKRIRAIGVKQRREEMARERALLPHRTAP